jgi:integrase
MARDENRLSARKATTAGDGWWADGRHLYLRVDGRRRRWIVKIVRDGVKRELGVGSLNTTSLALARKKRDTILAQLADGLDPIEEKRLARAAAAPRKTFLEAAAALIETNSLSWRTSFEGRQSARAEWTRSLMAGCRRIAATPIDAVTTKDIVAVIAPLWRAKKHRGARVLLQRIGAVLDYATAHGWRSGDSPARWAVIQHLAPKTPAGPIRHYAAMTWRDAPAFMRKLRASSAMSALCLEFLVLTAARSGEARGARFSEIDLGKQRWTIPAERMKAAAEHVVPLSAQAAALMRRMESVRTGDLVFEGLHKGRPITGNTLVKAMGVLAPGATVHGFRSAFRDWCGDHGIDRELAERALAHRFGSEVEAAYARSSLLERRRVVMEAWARFLDGEDDAAILPFQRRVE